ncbi:hypothetical protein R1flu_002305 [Riccia fluitans]|uniref:Pseudouridine-5'-phosphate glycosidase n=1 Tax=Riccia fluitans TaxID=41844 RepID=A0ABD1Y687_9MARC
MFASRIATIRQHISPLFLSARSSNNDVESLEKLGIRIEPSVRRALSEGLPVVALESTIISHGMPYPQNLSTAKDVENIVRQNGATPASIAILNGVPCIGLTEKELEYLAQCRTKAAKTARRDIAQVIAKGATGATTVSATMFFAAKAGIHVFVTGGIGGVHRLGESTLDISSDLTELGRTPVLVVCAGVKSILDIPRTLEYLETQGVTVVGYGTEEFPAFFTSKSGSKAPCRADSPEECAAIAETNLKLDLQSGILIGVPIPEQHAAAAELVEAAIQEALQETIEKNIQGNAVTPYLLKRVNELTGGGSLASNIELIKNNARVGAQISVALQEKLRRP